ncbi:MAG: FkbM family methyltransferase [Candidatus Omnitrophica bacterium]|nr:FkbM family methyltransferase [Candidatus Omnitrophota bacterium]
MNLLKRLKYADFNSVFLRKILGYFYKDGGIYKIPIGPLKGFRICYDKSINFHAVLGMWELQNLELLSIMLRKTGLINKDLVACDVGANIGLYSLWFYRYLSPGSVIYAFEPAPRTAEKLKHNVAINNASRVKIAELACTDKVGEADFFIGPGHHKSSLDREWASEGKACPEKIIVDAVTLDSFFYGKEKRQGPSLIKIDVEGAASLVLKGCKECVLKKRPFFLIESHNTIEDRAMCNLITDYEYKAYRITNHLWVKEPNETFPNLEGVWGTVFLGPAETHKQLSNVFR